MTELERMLYRALYKKSFYEFYKGFWKESDPSPYTDGAIIQFFCEVFQFMCRRWVGYTKPKVDTSTFNAGADIIDIRDSDKDRLCLNMPPRHSKSKIFNVMGATWLWSQYPIKAVSISHTFDLAKTMNEGRWAIINSPKFKELYNINTIANTKDSIIDDRGGQLYSQNRNALTGYGGDMIINDDLTNAMTAYKDMTEMQNAWDYYQNTMPSRINDVNKSVIFNIQQRLGINDITGHILKERDLRNRYIFISLPARFSKETYLVCPISGRVIHYNKGDGLWSERFGDYRQIEAEVGESVFRTQYLQEPRATDQAIINESMIVVKNQTEVPTIEQADMIYASHDFPVKDKETSDYLGSTLAYKVDNVLYIVDSLEKHMNFPSSINYVEALDRMYPSIVQIIEDKANGSPILQQLQGKLAGLQAYNPATASKSMRLESASVYMGNVVFVANQFDKLTQEWQLSDNLNKLILRLYEFPMVEHDDIVDAFSMLVNFVFLDKKYSVYARAFDAKNVIDYNSDLDSLYGAIFVNKEGDMWKLCNIKIKYGLESKIIVVKETSFRASMEEGIQKCFEFEPSAKVFIDCSPTQELAGKYQDKKTFVGCNIEDFDISVTNANLAFSKKRILICRHCRAVKSDIENFKFAKLKTEEVKYLTDKDGYVACLRSAIKYFGNII
jgi:predicted phage terminase large subunit-like protein